MEEVEAEEAEVEEVEVKEAEAEMPLRVSRERSISRRDDGEERESSIAACKTTGPLLW